MAYANWMTNLSDTLYLYDIAIPGTHDSATWKMITGETQCQTRSITEQLKDGIRFFDIRVGYNGQLYHGDFACSVTLNEVVDACITYLATYNSEVIMLMMSWEGVGGKIYSLSDFQEWCSSAFEKQRAAHWHLSATIPVIKDVRGKIVLVNGDNTGKPGLELGSFVRQNDWDTGDASQRWKERAELKIRLIRKFLAESKNSDNDGKMLMNSWNKQFNFMVPVKTYADYINSNLASVSSYPRGIQCMDFYRQDIVDRIIGYFGGGKSSSGGGADF